MTAPELTEDGFTVSPSQISTAMTCLRKWAWDKLEGIRGAPHRAAQNGTRVHSILEDWMRSGKPPDWNEKLVLDGRVYQPGQIATHGMHLLPPPGPHNSLEFDAVLGHWKGRIDLGYRATVEGVDIPVVVDFKTAGTYAYAHTEETLKKEAQAIVYANVMLAKMPDAPYAVVIFIYFLTKKPYGARRVMVTFTREEALRAIVEYDTVGSRLIQIRRTPGLKAMDVPANPAGCEAYGGCAFRDRCNLSPEERMRSYMMTNGEQTLEDKMAALLNGTAAVLNGASPPPIPGAPPPLPVEEPWILNPNDSRYEYQAVSRQQRLVQVAPPPIPVVPPIPQVVTAPIGAGGPYVAPSLPVGMINAPESIGIPEKAEPSLEPELLIHGMPKSVWANLSEDVQKTIIAAAKGKPAVIVAGDDLDALDREGLVRLCAQMGLESKGLREKGLRDKIRSARAKGAPRPERERDVVEAAPAAPPLPPPPLPASAPPLPLVGTMPSGAEVTRMPDAAASVFGPPIPDPEFRKQAIVLIVAAIVGGTISTMPEVADVAIVRRAVALVDMIERA